jgi:hypothetical protein
VPPPGGSGSSLLHVVRSEWTKLFSVRSTGWTLFAAFVATVGLGVLASWGTNHAWPQTSAADKATFDPTATSLAGLTLGQLAIAVLGVLILSGEYSTGGIHTTFTTVPQRMRVLTAKTLVLTVVSLVAGWIICFVSFYAGQPWFSKRGIGAAIGDPGVLRAVLGGGLYLGATALFGLAIALLLRHTAGAITLAVGLLLVVPPLLNLLPGAWGRVVVRYFTSNAGQHIAFVHQSGSNYLTPWVGFGVYCLWFVVPLVVGAWLLHRRDA